MQLNRVSMPSSSTISFICPQAIGTIHPTLLVANYRPFGKAFSLARHAAEAPVMHFFVAHFWTNTASRGPSLRVVC